MSKLNKIVLTIHRILGTLLSAVFLMWFLTGLVMLYHGHFPRADKSQKMEFVLLSPQDTVYSDASTSTVPSLNVTRLTVGCMASPVYGISMSVPVYSYSKGSSGEGEKGMVQGRCGSG